jgi:hypothetical protein
VPAPPNAAETPPPSPAPGAAASDAPERVPAQAYEKRLAELRAVIDDLRRRSGRVSVLRGVTFIAGAGLGAAVIADALPSSALWAAGAFGVIFVALVIAHAVLISKEAAVEQRIGLVQRALDRVNGKPPPTSAPVRPAPPDHPYAKDLDVFGNASLFELLDTTQTEPGETTLAAWLAGPSAPAAVAERQEAARELATLPAFREDLAVLGLRAETKGRPVAPLTAWAEGAPALDGPLGGVSGGVSKRTLVTAAAVLVPITLLLVGLPQIVGPQALGVFRRAWVVTLIAQVIILFLLRGSIEPLLAAAASRQAPFGRYQALFAEIERQTFKAPRLVALRDAIRGASGADGSSAMRSLESIIGYAELRHNGIIHIAAQTFLLWDLWCAVALERWRARSGRRVGAWFAALGELEAIASLGTFTFERPDHTFPEVTPGAPRFEAERLGHTLLPSTKRVTNDLTLGARPPGDGEAMSGPRGMALLVTGSNMSGKSTLLRACGVAAVLAQAGAPVCAARLVMSPLAVRTSIRIDDSLERGISHFYAELERLKSIVDTADAGDDVLFLLDEILHGTNSRERHIGAKAVVLHLIERGAIGAVSSHDLALADLAEESRGRIRNVHFEEIIREGRMAFDYKLKPGVVTTTNALRLMRLVGLDLPGLAPAAKTASIPQSGIEADEDAAQQGRDREPPLA